jgi:hypothetical protein
MWQRGTSFTAAGYSADRWYYISGSNNATVSRQTTSDTTNLPFIQYCARVQRNSGSSGTGDITFTQSMETINSIPFVGKTITLSFYARAGADYSGGATGFTSQIRSGTGTDQNLAAGYTGSNSFISNAQALTTTWTRYSYTGTVPTTATELGIYTGYTPSGTAGANDYYEITGVQIDVGSVALPFRTYAATIQGELAACQRYYWRHTAGAATVTMAMGISESATTNWVAINNIVPLRVPATSIDISGLNCTDAVSFTTAVGSATISSASTLMTRAVFNTSGQTSKQAIFITSQAAGSYIGLSAEL